MPRSPSNNTLLPLFHKLSAKLGSKQAKSEMKWLVEHVHKEFYPSKLSAHNQQQRLSARIWRDQPAPSIEELTQDSKRFSSVQWAWLRQAVSDRTEQHKPLQYIIRTQPFGKVNIKVRPPILIPRWETEEWTVRLADLIKTAPGGPGKLNILDACTGSGCISLGLASELSMAEHNIVGVDVSQKAVDLALENLQFNSLLQSSDCKSKVAFHQLDLLKPVDKVTSQLNQMFAEGIAIDMVVSNPPYVTLDEYAQLEPDVREWEDMAALVPTNSCTETAKDLQGTEFIEQLAKIASENLSQQQQQQSSGLPKLVVEIGGKNQVEPVSQIMNDHGFNSIEVWNDMVGTERVVLGYHKK